jgi:hypothetical protein
MRVRSCTAVGRTICSFAWPRDVRPSRPLTISAGIAYCKATPTRFREHTSKPILPQPPEGSSHVSELEPQATRPASPAPGARDRVDVHALRYLVPCKHDSLAFSACNCVFQARLRHVGQFCRHSSMVSCVCRRQHLPTPLFSDMRAARSSSESLKYYKDSLASFATSSSFRSFTSLPLTPASTLTRQHHLYFVLTCSKRARTTIAKRRSIP